MIQEAFCSFEVAKLLKEKGFDEPTTHWYNIKEDLINDYEVSYKNFTSPQNVWLAPTHQMAMAWLREKGLYIAPKYQCFCGVKNKPYYLWEPRVLRLSSNNIIYPQPLDVCEHYKTYEEAVEAALKYALEYLI